MYMCCCYKDGFETPLVYCMSEAIQCSSAQCMNALKSETVITRNLQYYRGITVQPLFTVPTQLLWSLPTQKPTNRIQLYSFNWTVSSRRHFAYYTIVSSRRHFAYYTTHSSLIFQSTLLTLRCRSEILAFSDSFSVLEVSTCNSSDSTCRIRVSLSRCSCPENGEPCMKGKRSQQPLFPQRLCPIRQSAGTNQQPLGRRYSLLLLYTMSSMVTLS